MTLTYDPEAAVALLSRRDKQLAKIIRRAGAFTLLPPKTVSPFESLMRAIVGQQLSGKAAATIFGRVRELFPDPKRLRPEALVKLSDAALRGAGLSGNKVLAVRDLAAKTLDGTVPTMRRLRSMDDASIIAQLTEVRGIGVWTVEMLLMFTLGRPDVLPMADLGIRRGFMLTYGHAEMPEVEHLLDRGEHWRPFRSVASWYLWRAVDLDRLDKAEQKRTGR